MTSQYCWLVCRDNDDASSCQSKVLRLYKYYTARYLHFRNKKQTIWKAEFKNDVFMLFISKEPFSSFKFISVLNFVFFFIIVQFMRYKDGI